MKKLALVVLAACTRTSAPTASTSASAPATASAPASATAAGITRRCLPVVSRECGCTYSCGVGEPSGDRWTVHHPFWKDAPLTAKIVSWCVPADGGACTDAFAVELPCDIVCAPRPADATCHFDSSGACVSATPQTRLR